MSKLGAVVLWSKRGPDVFDCSGLVAWALHCAGGKDLRATHNAQMMADETPALTTDPTLEPLAGDLVFYGPSVGTVIHVAIWMATGRVLSADGASSHRLTLADAKANPAARVKLHHNPRYRKDFLAIHRNKYLDDIVSPLRGNK